MEKRQKILLYGNTLVLAGIQASLRDCPSFEVIAPYVPANQAELLASPPDVVIFDMEAVQPEFLLAQMQSLPGLLLIGIDPESHEVLLTGEAAHSITLDQITQILRSRDCNKDR